MLEYLQNIRLVTEKNHFSYLSFSFQTQLNSNITDSKVSSTPSQFSECQACVIVKLFKVNFNQYRSINTDNFNPILVKFSQYLCLIHLNFHGRSLTFLWDQFGKKLLPLSITLFISRHKQKNSDSRQNYDRSKKRLILDIDDITKLRF